MSDKQYGNMPMGMGGVMYKGMSLQASFYLELMEQENELAILNAQTYGDKDNGMVAQFLKSSIAGADNAGDVIKDDAKNCLIQACVGGAALIGTAAAAGYTSYKGSGVDAQIKDAEAIRNTPGKGDMVLKGCKPGSADDIEIDKRVTDMTENGNFDRFKPKLSGLKDGDLPAAKIDQQLNEAAIQRAKNPQYKETFLKKLDAHIDDLKAQNRKLDQSFQNSTSVAQMVSQSGTAAGQTVVNLDKAKAQTAATTETAIASIEQNVAQKQSQFIDQAQQQAATYQQAADAASAALAQVQYVRG